MRNKYSETFLSIINEGKTEARRHRSKTVRPEHLLMALLKRRGTIIDEVTKVLHISKTDITIDCERLLLEDVDNSTADTTADEGPLMDIGTEQLIKRASLEAMLKKNDTVQPKHLLLAILNAFYDNQARSILEQHDITYEKVSNYIIQTEDETPTIEQSLSEVDFETHKTNNATSNMKLSDDEFDDTIDNTSKDPSNKSTTEQSTQTHKAPHGKLTPVIDAFSVDLIVAAANGSMDNVVGREREIMRLQEILCRRKKNNPILIGEAGVGKSAIVEGLAQMIANHTTSPLLHNKRLVSLDLASMVAGTKYRGQFEERIKNLIKELEQNPDIIVFIDEIHTIIGAGNANGSMDAANILKPALARGVIQCIGATTLDEYRKSIEKDGALERRFQKIIVEPTSPEETVLILNNIKERYEQHHNVTYTSDAINACVKLTQRYITDRAFPDKAIDVLDEVGAHIHLAHASVPSDVTRLNKEIDEAKNRKLKAVQDQDFELAANCRDLQIKLETQLEDLNQDWKTGNNQSRETISTRDVEDVVSSMTGVPVQRLNQNEGERLRTMAGRLKEKVIAQDAAIDKMVRAIQRNRVGLHDANHPIGVFMFLGPTGVGKTYLAKKLAEEMFGTSDSIIRIDMSEYSESFNTSRLIGAPPGYVGYEEGGQLTEKVKRKPYSIVLLDEIEKANSKVFNMLLQVMDEGRMTDGNGRLIDFRNTIIIMTSNTGTRQLKEFSNGVGFTAAKGASLEMTDKNKEYARSIIQKSLSKQFAPEFLNRLDEILMFDQLDKHALLSIIELELEHLYKRVTDLGYTLIVSNETKEKLIADGYDVQYGARPLKRAIQTHIEDMICEKILSGELQIGTTIEV